MNSKYELFGKFNLETEELKKAWTDFQSTVPEGMDEEGIKIENERRKEQAKSLEDRYAYLQQQYKSDPMLAEEMMFMEDMKNAGYGTVSPSDWFTFLQSANPDVLNHAAKMQPMVTQRFIDDGATLAEQEEFMRTASSLAMVPRMADKEMHDKYMAAMRSGKTLSGEELKALNDEQAVAGNLVEGAVPVDASGAPARTTDDALIESMKEYRKVMDNTVTNPVKAARAFTESMYRDQGRKILEPDLTGVSIEEDAVGAHKVSALRKELARQYGVYQNAEGYNYASRNVAVVADALKAVGITPENTPAYEYYTYSNIGFDQVMKMRELNFKQKALVSSIKNKQQQMDALSGVADQLNSMLTKSPDAILSALSGSQGSMDAMSIIAMVEGGDKMELLKQVGSQEFVKDWSNVPDESKFTYFTDRVLDYMFDGTRNLKAGERAHAIQTVKKLKKANYDGRLGDEPIIAHLMSGLYDKFASTMGPKLNEKSAMEIRDFQENATAKVKIGDSTYTVSPGAGRTPEEHAERQMATREAVEFLSGNEYSKPLMEQMGILNDGIINPASQRFMTFMDIARNMTGNPLQNESIARIYSGEQQPVIDAMMSAVSTVGRSNKDEMFKASGAKVYTTRDYLIEKFGGKKNKLGVMVANQIAKNPNMAMVAERLDPVTLAPLIVTAIEDIEANVDGEVIDQMMNITTPASQKISAKGINASIGLPDILPILANEEPADYPAIIDDYFSNAIDESIDAGFTGLLQEADKAYDMKQVVENSIKSARIVYNNAKDATGVDRELALEKINEMQKILNSIHGVINRINGIRLDESGYFKANLTELMSNRPL